MGTAGNWHSQEYSAKSKRESMAQVQAEIEEARQEYRDRMRHCRCNPPLPGRKYMGQQQCNLCLKLIDGRRP